VFLVRSMLRFLGQCHAKGFIYRDVKVCVCVWCVCGVCVAVIPGCVQTHARAEHQPQPAGAAMRTWLYARVCARARVRIDLTRMQRTDDRPMRTH
jgi:hypothetical protein